MSVFEFQGRLQVHVKDKILEVHRHPFIALETSTDMIYKEDLDSLIKRYVLPYLETKNDLIRICVFILKHYETTKDSGTLVADLIEKHNIDVGILRTYCSFPLNLFLDEYWCAK